MTETFPWESIFGNLTIAIILSFLIERILSAPFEHKKIGKYFRGKKELIAFALSYAICYYYDFDLLQVLFEKESRVIGYILTAGLITGGSKGSLALFRDVLNIRKTDTGDTKDAR